MDQARAAYSLWQVTRYMPGLGARGFGGPVALRLLWKGMKCPEPAIVVLAAIAGLIIYPTVKT